MTDEPEPKKQEPITGFTDLEIILAILFFSAVSGGIGVLIGIFIET